MDVIATIVDGHPDITRPHGRETPAEPKRKRARVVVLRYLGQWIRRAGSSQPWRARRGDASAVARVVERIKAEGKWTPEVGHALRRAFLKLVRVNDEGRFTRQPCRWADLPDLAAPVLEAFVKARLLGSNGDVVEERCGEGCSAQAKRYAR